jgi:protein gp37
MGADTKIEWATHTFNPWTGCQKVSPACDHCYAEAQAKRAPATFGGWGPHAERKRTSASYWRQPLLWNKRAAKDGTRPRVFCASMADVFDNAVPQEWREDLWRLVDATPHLDWLLLTKRPQLIMNRLPIDWKGGRPNVWLGTTVENQAEADRRIPHLLAVTAAKRFLSMEPLLGPVDIAWALGHPIGVAAGFLQRGSFSPGIETLRPLDWIIAGGESGPKARPSHPDWFRSLRDQCQSACVSFFFKQWGEWIDHETALNTLGDDDPRVGDGRCRVSSGQDGLSVLGSTTMIRIGKKAAGAMLDGREWREVPA